MTWLSARHNIAGIVAVLLLMTGLADALLLDEQRASNLQSSRAASAALASSYADGFSYWTKHIDDQLVSCRKNLASQGDGLLAGVNAGGPVSVFQKKILTTCNHGLDGIGAFVLYDANGQAYASSTGHFPAGNALSKDDVFRELKAGGPDVLRLSRPMAGSSASLSFYGVRRLARADGGFAGAIAAEFLISVTEAYLGRTLPAPRCVIYARRDGTILLRYPSTAGDAINTIPADSPWYDVVRAGGGTYLSADTALQPATLAAVQLVSPLPLVIEVSMLRRDALADYKRRKPLIIAVGVAIVAGIVLLGYFVAAQYARIESAQRTLADKNALLEATQSQLQATLGNISQGVSFFGRDMRLIVSNRRYAEIYRLDPDRVIPGMTLAEIVALRVAAGTDVMRAPDEYVRLIANIPDLGHDRVISLELRDGRTVAIQQRRMEDGGWVATHEDITERRRAESEIAFLARHDVLTGLPNRSVLQEFIERALPEVARGAQFAVLFLDLDRFKAVNDTLGHGAGDALLKQVAARLRASVRQTDTIARFGGDEFVILQPLMELPDGAMRLAQRIIDLVGEPYVLDGTQASIGVSVGIAMAPADGMSAEALLKNADMALYLAKSEGRGTFRFFEPEMDAKLTRRHDIERDLHSAIAEDGFELHYQPIVKLNSGAVRAFEALIRWNHPVFGRLPPAEFIGIAEECGLIGALGEWVLREACRQATQWPEAIGISVNLSPLQFRDGSLVEAMTGILSNCGLAPSRLEVEITETVLLAGSQANIATLHRLRALGVSIAMDDFGVGYSSLSHLHSFPFDRIKIDGSFVANMMQSREALFIVRAIIGLCQDLGVSTTAEGVETREQLRVLREEMASEGQGYYFAKPMPAEQIPAFLGRDAPAPVAWTKATVAAVGT
jgi:diguanylate cyclase (GGDEF)-like protein